MMDIKSIVEAYLVTHGYDDLYESDHKSIVKTYLVTHGYDGLYESDNDCACVLSDLMPCDQPMQSCKPGHVISDDDDDGFMIGER